MATDLCALVADDDPQNLQRSLADTEYSTQELQKAIYKCAESNYVRSLDAILQVQPDVDINFFNADSGFTPLMVAASNGHIDAVRRIIAHPTCRIDEEDTRERIALHYALFTYKLDCVRALLDAGSDVEAEDDEGYTAIWTALIKAPLCGYEAFTMILCHGCDLEKVSYQTEETMLSFAIRQRQHDTIGLLLAAGCKVGQLWRYIEYRYNKTKIKKSEEEFMEGLVGLVCHARDLSFIAAMKVRQCLGTRIPQKVKHLELSQELKDDIALTHLGEQDSV